MATSPLPPRVQNFLTWQAKFYAEQAEEAAEVLPGPFVTISRAYGCEGIPLAERLAEKLNAVSARPTPWVVMGKEVVEAISQKKGDAARFVDALSHARRGRIRQTVETLLGRTTEYQAFETLAEALLTLAEAGRVVLVGRGAAIVSAEAERGIHVRLVAPLEWRSRKIARERGISVPEAEALASKGESERESFIREFTGKDISSPERYDMVFNNARLSFGEVADLVVAAMRAKGYV